MTGEHTSLEQATPIDPLRFREVLGHFPTGVAVITAHGPDGPIGMAVNSLTSVSLSPPLILFCPARSSETWPEIRPVGAVCVNVMARHHGPLARQFALKRADRFAGVSHRHTPSGPALDDAVAWIECAIEDECDAGDHTIVVARVLTLAADGAAEPLVFLRGAYGSFSPSLSPAQS